MKTIRTPRDLAVNGAPPAFEEQLHVGRPNIGSRDAFMRMTNELFDRAWLTNNGPLVQELESRIAQRLGVKHCVSMCNGTIALEIAIRALGMEGEVIIPSYTFVATAHALHWQALVPVFADIDPSTHNLDPDAVRRMITPRTTGIIGVHLWGRPAPVHELQQIADEHGLQLMFDAAHGFDCSFDGRKIGNFGRCEVLSFHATKVFNTFEGGAIVTNDDDLAETIKLMRNFGFSGYDNVIHPGTNGKMVEANAAMGLVNLDSLSTFIEANKKSQDRYASLFSEIQGAHLLAYDPETTPNYHYAVVELDDAIEHRRNEIVAALHAENILARKYFWPGAHGMKPYRDLYPHAHLMLSETQRIAKRVIVLPNGPSVQDTHAAAIASVFQVVLDQH